jgi:hypothetical protein
MPVDVDVQAKVGRPLHRRCRASDHFSSSMPWPVTAEMAWNSSFLRLMCAASFFSLSGLAESILVAQTIMVFFASGKLDCGAGIVVHGLLGGGDGEAGQLLVDDLEVFHGVGAAAGVAHIDQVEQQAGALDVAEELGAEAGAEVGAFDEAGHVGDDVGELVGLFADGDDAEVGLEGGEGVIGDFGLGGGDAGDEGGLAGVGVADQAYVGEELEDQAVVALFAGAAEFVLARGLVDGGGEVLVAAAAAPAFGDDDALVGGLEVVDQLAGVLVVKSCADRDLQVMELPSRPVQLEPMPCWPRWPLCSGL